MKSVSERELREHIAEHLDGSEPVVVTRDGRNAGVLFPMAELRRLFLDVTDDIAKQLDEKGVTDDDVERAFAAYRKNRCRDFDELPNTTVYTTARLLAALGVRSGR